MRSILLASALLLSFAVSAQDPYLFVGTYTGGQSEGIYVYRFNTSTGEAKPVSTTKTDNPSYLALAPGGHFLYAVNENHHPDQGGISAFGFDKATGKLTFINKQESGGDDPCYVSVDPQGKWAFVANYSGGSLSALPIHGDGSLGPIAELIQHSGKGANPQRQEKPHVHSVIFSPDKHYLLSADLGLDRLMVYRFDPAARQPLTDPTDSLVSIQAGSGPRHLAFYPERPYVYLLDELSGTVDAFHYHGGRFKHIQRISSHPAGYTGQIGSADIHVSPNGKFLYASNRGDANSLAIYSIDPETGQLALKGFQSTLGKTPRNFLIDPTGHWLLAANQQTNNIVVFGIDQQTGRLKPGEKQIQIPSPVCLQWLPK